MLRITGLYPATLSPGSRAGFQGPNPPSVPFGTQVTAAWLDDVQENICAVVEGTGGTLSDAGSVGGADQLLNAIRPLAGAAYTLITATGALTVANAGHVNVDCTAGNVVLTLPLAAALNGSVASTETIDNSIGFQFFRQDNTANTLTIQRAGSDSFNFAGLTGTSYQLGPLTGADVYSDANATWQMQVTTPSPGPPGWQEWTAHGTNNFTVPPGKTSVRATVIGAAGGGGGTHQSSDAGVSGAGSAECVFNIAVTPGEVLTINVGQGGTAGAGNSSGSPTAGGNGGDTTIYTGATELAKVAGGAGGAYATGGAIATTGVGTGAGGPTAYTGATLVSTKGATGSGPAILVGSTLLNAQGGTPLGIGLGIQITATPAQPTYRGAGGWGGIYVSSTAGGGSAGADAYVRLEW